MKKINYLVLILSFLLISTGVFSQDDKATRPSPPATAMNSVNGVDIKVDYSQPAVKGRTVWGDLVPYEKVWRTGANEATTIEFSKAVKINGEDVAAGKYSLFTIPNKESWTVILNEEPKQWGAYKYDKELDALRFTVNPQKMETNQERLTFNVDDAGKVSMMWADLMFSFDVK